VLNYVILRFRKVLAAVTVSIMHYVNNNFYFLVPIYLCPPNTSVLSENKILKPFSG